MEDEFKNPPASMDYNKDAFKEGGEAFWSIFEDAKKEVETWPEWKKQIQVGIYGEPIEDVLQLGVD